MESTAAVADIDNFKLEEFQKDFEKRAEENKKKLGEVEGKMQELKILMDNLEKQKKEIEDIEGEITKLATDMKKEEKKEEVKKE